MKPGNARPSALRCDSEVNAKQAGARTQEQGDQAQIQNRVMVRVAKPTLASSPFQRNHFQKPGWNSAKPRLCTPARRISQSPGASTSQPPSRGGRGDTHMAMRARNTGSPCGLLTTMSIGSS